MNGQHRITQLSMRPRWARPTVAYVAISVHPCASCGALTAQTWFCVECRDRSHPHVEDDPYDELGGEAS